MIGGQFFQKYWNLINKNELMALGGQVTYYMILSFFPLLILIITLIGYANVNSEQFFNDLKYILPEETYLIVESIVYEVFATRSPTLLSFGMLGTIWASLNGISALMRGIVKAYGLEEVRTFWRQKLVSIAFLLIITLTVLLSFPLLFWGQSFGILVFKVLGINSIFPYIWQKFRVASQIVLLIIAFITLTQMATSSKYNIRLVMPGSVLAATSWIGISLLFSFYFNHFDNFALTYGSIAGIMILLLWLYWSVEILLLGCAFNAVLIETKLKHKDL